MNKTKEITRKKIIDVAENVQLTFNQANFVLLKYMYTKTYHTANIDKTTTADFQRLIDEYMAFNRKNISYKIFLIYIFKSA